MSTETLIQKEKLITVANLRDTAHGLRCDRGTPMGNPFVLLAKEPIATRKICVAAYGFYLHLVANKGHEPIDAIDLIQSRHKPGQRPLLVSSTKPPSKETFLSYLADIESRYLDSEPLTLLCWCAPLPCHCDRIAAYLRWKYAPNNCPPYI
jgi:hypothetical protein